MFKRGKKRENVKWKWDVSFVSSSGCLSFLIRQRQGYGERILDFLISLSFFLLYVGILRDLYTRHIWRAASPSLTSPVPSLHISLISHLYFTYSSLIPSYSPSLYPYFYLFILLFVSHPFYIFVFLVFLLLPS